MTGKTPSPLWERVLLALLPPQDRESISGDLLEEYREQRLPRLGFVRANLWYLRQCLSLASIRLWGETRLQQLLVILCFCVLASGTWLGVTEVVLRHPGFIGRCVVAGCLVVQAFTTLFALFLQGRFIFRAVALVSSMAAGLFGVLAIFQILHARHFEGFVLLIGIALVLEGVLSAVVLTRMPHKAA